MELTELTIETNSDFSEMVAYILEENGAEGASIIDKKDYYFVLGYDYWDYMDEELENSYSDKVIVRTCLENPNKEIIENIKNQLENAVKFFNATYSLSVRVVNDENWKDEWKKYYKQLTLGNVVINPIWLDASSIKNKTVVNINPGLAFGTGQHQTTSACVELLQNIDLKQKSAIDVGCGSGILGITALKLGAKECYFTDIEIDAIKSAKENIALNNISSHCEFFCEPNLKNVKKTFDVVVANMTVDLIKMLKTDLIKVAKENSYFVLSGIIDGREKEIEAEFKSVGTIMEHIKKDNWHAYIIKRN